ncbi:hypothetical protein VB711_06950 [Cronbergia sp. UHCC 0137]|uniref:hypothetical protein n=1 Tax=Cronbergia sp. UHCC 0137 TaxID=3110239 RepID=UPI002B2162EA|nr:hypothetical protein [Cronbergia sp. UHCC 0137]MEA5617576.1 hypothetical protein [Cronbergia sp. UHCC 0137]
MKAIWNCFLKLFIIVFMLVTSLFIISLDFYYYIIGLPIMLIIFFLRLCVTYDYKTAWENAKDIFTSYVSFGIVIVRKNWEFWTSLLTSELI